MTGAIGPSQERLPDACLGRLDHLRRAWGTSPRARAPPTARPWWGRPLVRVGEDVSEKLDTVPAEFFVHRHIYGKWACRCCHKVVQPSAVPEIIESGIAASGFVAHTLIGPTPAAPPGSGSPPDGGAVARCDERHTGRKPATLRFVHEQQSQRVSRGHESAGLGLACVPAASACTSHACDGDGDGSDAQLGRQPLIAGFGQPDVAASRGLRC